MSGLLRQATGAALGLAAILVLGAAALAQDVPGVREEHRCAAGFGCTGLSSTAAEAQSALGYESAEAARDGYAAKYPDAYVDDALAAMASDEQSGNVPDGGSLQSNSRETIDLDELESTAHESVDRQDMMRCAAGFGCQGLTVTSDDAKAMLGVNTGPEARDVYAQEYPDAYANDAFNSEGEESNPIDLDGIKHTPQETANEQDLMRCAAGFGCEGLAVDSDNAKVLLKLDSQAAAIDAYKKAYPDAYGRDENPAEGDPDNPIELFDGDELATTDENNGVIDLFEDGGGKKPIDLFGAQEQKPANSSPAYASWEGYSEKPCPGALYESPLFMPGIAMSTCLAGNGPAPECGLPAANLYCIAAVRSPGALCYGVTTASRAASAGTYCEGGSCQVFSYIVCK